jgi:hypothetical protein
VFWWFERRGEYVRCEARRAPDGRYELCVTDASGTERVERFDDSAALTHRQQEVEQTLAIEGWDGPHGWTV